MKTKFLILSLLINISLAFSVENSESKNIPTEKATISVTAEDNLNLLTSQKKILFLKNPCFSIKGYSFSHYRGFGFEDGIVKKYRDNGTIKYSRASSLYDFLVKNKVCAPVSKKNPEMRIDFQNLNIWK
ncbi:MAG: hypothetical protein KDD45_09450 [Bdellovibrionales bacterium]|nr:hypothetical protein [Bdellovibrionales bacterium]